MKNDGMDYVYLGMSQLRQMEVVDLNKGRRLGFISDLVFDDGFTRIDYIVIPPEGSLFSFFKRKEEMLIKWETIRAIGTDIIIVDTTEKQMNELAHIL